MTPGNRQGDPAEWINGHKSWNMDTAFYWFSGQEKSLIHRTKLLIPGFRVTKMDMVIDEEA